MQQPTSFGDQLRRYRELAGLTQEELAEQAGLTAKAIGALERGERQRPYPRTIHLLAQALNLSDAERSALLATLQRSPTTVQPTPSTPPLPASPRPARLPIPPTALIGREVEEAELRRRLLDPACRLVTLTGAGGAGKTRLALQIALDLGHHFADGVGFVALAQIMSADHVAAAIADVLGCPLLATQTPEESLLHFLRDRALLLVIDNMEHLLDATPLLATLVRDAPGVRLLVTSRERLRLHGEWVFELGGLATPAEDTSEVERSDAVLLFLDRARQLVSDFTLTPANRASVARICRLLDGMPLGIELAAAWVRALSPDEIATEVTRGLDFLTLSDRDADPRHRSMRAVIDHSWALLTPDEQRVLARFSVFRGGCTREAAEAVAGATLPVLVSLLDKSLIRRNTAGRYEMHELVRQYAADKLAADPHEVLAAYDQHCDYYARWINDRDAALKGPQQHLAVATITVEIDNLRAAWQYAIEQRRVEALWWFTERVVLQWFYELRSWYQEAEAICCRAAEALRTPPPTTKQEQQLLGNFIGNHGWFACRRGRPDIGLELLEESVAILRPLEYPPFLFFALEQLAYILFLSGEFERPVALIDEALAVAQQIDDPWIKSHACFIRAAIFADRQPEVAYARFQEGLPHIRMVGDRYHLILSLIHLGEIALAVGQVSEAERSFAEALERSAEVSNGVGEVLARIGLAQVACARGAWADAIAHGMEAVARSNEVGEISGQAKALVTLGEAQAGAGDHTTARNSFNEAISVSLAARVLPTAINAWVALAALDIEDGRASEPLLIILALVKRHTATSRSTAARADQLWRSLAALVDSQTLADAEQTASVIAPDHLGPLLRAYAEGRAATMLATLGAPQVPDPAPLPSIARTPRQVAKHAFDGLTDREREVAVLIAQGYTNRQIAEALVLSERTVTTHVGNILGKLGLPSRTHVARWAIDKGLVAS